MKNSGENDSENERYFLLHFNLPLIESYLYEFEISWFKQSIQRLLPKDGQKILPSLDEWKNIKFGFHLSLDDFHKGEIPKLLDPYHNSRLSNPYHYCDLVAKVFLQETSSVVKSRMESFIKVTLLSTEVRVLEHKKLWFREHCNDSNDDLNFCKRQQKIWRELCYLRVEIAVSAKLNETNILQMDFVFSSIQNRNKLLVSIIDWYLKSRLLSTDSKKIENEQKIVISKQNEGRNIIDVFSGLKKQYEAIRSDKSLGSEELRAQQIIFIKNSFKFGINVLQWAIDTIKIEYALRHVDEETDVYGNILSNLYFAIASYYYEWYLFLFHTNEINQQEYEGLRQQASSSYQVILGFRVSPARWSQLVGLNLEFPIPSQVKESECGTREPVSEVSADEAPQIQKAPGFNLLNYLLGARKASEPVEELIPLNSLNTDKDPSNAFTIN